MNYHVEITFTEPLLGTLALDPEVFTNFIVNGSTGEDEMETLPVEEQIERGTTGFHRLDGKPLVYDYMLKGFFKDACGMLRRAKGTESAGLTAYKKIIDGLLFVSPRRVPIDLAGDVGILERPLRAQTAQGERIALARSETAPVGSVIRFDVQTIGKDVSEELLREWLDYGALRGLGQWRNGGYGRFTYTLTSA